MSTRAPTSASPRGRPLCPQLVVVLVPLLAGVLVVLAAAAVVAFAVLALAALLLDRS